MTGIPTDPDRTPKPCTHPLARHEHGTRVAYVRDRCRCVECTEAAKLYERARTRARIYGRASYVDAQPVKDHIAALVASGISVKQIAATTGLGSTVSRIVYGAPDRGRAETKRVHRATAAKILAVKVGDRDLVAEGRPVDGTGTARRIQALALMGWSVPQIAQRAGKTPGTLRRALSGATVKADTARAVSAAYDQLWSTPAPASAASTRTRNRAAREGWAPPLAWDDDTIDDPAATPAETARPGAGTRQRDGGAASFDAITDCAAWGMTRQQTADRLGISRASIEKWLERYDDGTVRDRFARNAIVDTHRKECAA